MPILFYKHIHMILNNIKRCFLYQPSHSNKNGQLKHRIHTIFAQFHTIFAQFHTIFAQFHTIFAQFHTIFAGATQY
jgi:hypothetical protein